VVSGYLALPGGLITGVEFGVGSGAIVLISGSTPAGGLITPSDFSSFSLSVAA
jgi:hypothetical protein